MSTEKDNNQDGFVYTPIQGPNGPLTAVLINEYACFEKHELKMNESQNWDREKLNRVRSAAFSLLYRLFSLDGGPRRIREDLIKMYEMFSTSDDFDLMKREDREDLRLSYTYIKELMDGTADIFNLNSELQGKRKVEEA